MKPDVAFDYLSIEMKKNFNETIKTILNNDNNNFDIVPNSEFQLLLWFPTIYICHHHCHQCHYCQLTLNVTTLIGNQISPDAKTNQLSPTQVPWSLFKCVESVNSLFLLTSASPSWLFRFWCWNSGNVIALPIFRFESVPVMLTLVVIIVIISTPRNVPRHRYFDIADTDQLN